MKLGMETFTYFVPVDFSACSYNALHYATMLARCSPGSVKLFHVIDLEEIPDSENPVVISFAIDRLVKEAKKKMKSLREIISLEGIHVKEEIVMGNVEVQLLKEIAELKPDIVVMGKNKDKTFAHGMVKKITRNTNVPVLVVPQSHIPKIPSRAVLASTMDAQSQIQLAPFFDIIKKISHQLSILNVRSNYFRNAKDALNWIENLNATYGVNATLLPEENNDNLKEIKDYLRSNKVDLLCTVSPSNSFFEKFFPRNISDELTDQSDVPVLVIRP